MRRSARGMVVSGGIAAALVMGNGVAFAGPPTTIPAPGQPGYCGAHTSPWNCWSDVRPARPGEDAFIDQRLRFDMQGVPTDRTRLLQIARGVCQSLSNGTGSNDIVRWLADDLGIREGQAGQLFIMIQETACS
ncbi:DUF732 domain-containing protein [Gordonia sp. PvP123]